jgi:transposase-like protein
MQQAIWLYVRFTLSFRDVEDLLAERGIAASWRKHTKQQNQLLKVDVSFAIS